MQLALIHAQFEIIHSFRDGNGHIGRILVPVFPYEKKLLSRPMFYLSQYPEAHRILALYERLKAQTLALTRSVYAGRRYCRLPNWYGFATRVRALFRAMLRAAASTPKPSRRRCFVDSCALHRRPE